MGKKYKRLFEQITSDEALQKAFRNARKGKLNSSGFLNFNEFAQARIVELGIQLRAKTWQPHQLRQFIVYEPKKRLISAPAFSDRIVHHSLCAVIDPIFDSTFLPYSFACRIDKGTHAGVRFIQAELRKGGYTHFLKTDFKSFFPSIDRPILHQEIRRKITCKDTLWLIEQIIPTTGKGVPIGALTSQLSANIYGNILDQYLHHVLKVRFARYMDDVIVLGHSSQDLHIVKEKLEKFAHEKMQMTLSHWQIAPVGRGINFLGYRIWKHHKLLRKSSVIRAKRKIKIFTQIENHEELLKFIGSWKGHAEFADTSNLRWWLERRYQVVANLRLTRNRTRKSRTTMLEQLVLRNHRGMK